MRFDIVVPCYNYARYLRGCVESVLHQDGVEVRVLIIDDCSSDDTPDVGRLLTQNDNRVEYRRHKVNQRHIKTYNEGFEWASGDATLLLSADDLLTPGSFRRAAELFRAYPDVGLIYGEQIVFNEKPPMTPDVTECRSEVIAGRELVRRMCFTGSNPVNTPTAMVRTDLVKQVGGYHFALPHTADMHYWLRIAARASVGIVHGPQAYKRMHGQNMQLDCVNRAVLDLEQRLAAFETFFSQDADLLDEGDELRRSAHRALAQVAFWSASRAFETGPAEQCPELLDFALGLDPTLKDSQSWQRLQWKRRFGQSAWKVLGPLSNLLRGHRSAVAN